MTDPDFIVVHSETIADGVILRPVGDIDLARAPSLKQHLSDAKQLRK